MDRFQQQYGAYPAQVVADGGFTNHESVIAMHARDINSSGASVSVACSDPKQKEEARKNCDLEVCSTSVVDYNRSSSLVIAATRGSYL